MSMSTFLRALMHASAVLVLSTTLAACNSSSNDGDKEPVVNPGTPDKPAQPEPPPAKQLRCAP